MPKRMVQKGVLPTWAGYIVAVIILLVGWHVTAMQIDSPALPTPITTLLVFQEALPAMWPEFLTSLWRVALSLLLGAGFAIPVALLFSRNPKTDAILGPLLFLTYPVPKIVLLPVLLVLLGLGNEPKVLLMALTVFFQVLMALRDAVKSVPASLIMAARSLGANRLQIYRHVIIPAMLPDLFTALRISSGTAIAILFIAESIAGTTGLGWFIVDSWGILNYPRMFAGIVMMALLGIVVYEAIALVERRVTRWRRAGIQ